MLDLSELQFASSPVLRLLLKSSAFPGKKTVEFVNEPEASALERFGSCVRPKERPNVRPLAGSVREVDQFEFLSMCVRFVY